MNQFFLSNYNNKIDNKGRASLPSSFREILYNKNYNNIIIFKSLTKKCLEGCCNDYLENLEKIINTFDPFSELRDIFLNAIFADSISLNIDNDGRIILTKQYLEYANLNNNKNILFVGKGRTFEIWNPTLYEEYTIKCRQLAIEKSSLLKWN